MSSALVLGVGNPLMGDDGAGIVAVDQLRLHGDLPPDISVLDGGIWGMNLLPEVEGARRLLILDAIRMPGAPGTVVRLERSELPRYLGLKISPHQVDLRDVLALAEWRGTLPEMTVALGIVPERIAWGEPLSSTVEQALPRLVGSAVALLREWQAAAAERLADA